MSYLLFFAKVKNFFSKGREFFARERLYPLYTFLFFMSFFLLSYMTLDRVFSLDDGFFHIRFAELFREHGMTAFTDFQSIYFSKMGIGQDYFVYYNFLFYLALIPFTFVEPLVLGMKLYGVIALSGAFTMVYIFLRKVSTKYSFLWTLLFLMILMQSGWLFRFTLARPFTLAPVFLVLMLYFIHQKKHWSSAIIAFLYFYWHTATFIFPFCLAVGYFLFEQFYGKKPDWKMIFVPFFGTLGAVILAYLVSPGIIAYLRDVIFPVFFDTALTKETGIAEGGEVYGRNIFSTITSFFWFIAGLFVLGAYEIGRYIQSKRNKLKVEDELDLSIQPLRSMLFMASLVFLAATTLSGRFLDYFVYFSFLYVVIVMNDVSRFFEIQGSLFRRSFLIGSSVVIIFLFGSLSLNFYDSLAGSSTQTSSQGTAEWLNTNLEKGKIILNVDWSAFPTLYYFTGDKFRYATGLEPRFLYDLDSKMYWIWNNMGSGVYCEESDCTQLLKQREKSALNDESKKKWNETQGDLVADAVLQIFKTDIVVTSINRKSLLEVMDHSSRFKKEFFDDKNSAYAVYRVIPSGEDQ